jgi:hypothetical protein
MVRYLSDRNWSEIATDRFREAIAEAKRGRGEE